MPSFSQEDIRRLEYIAEMYMNHKLDNKVPAALEFQQNQTSFFLFLKWTTTQPKKPPVKSDYDEIFIISQLSNGVYKLYAEDLIRYTCSYQKRKGNGPQDSDPYDLFLYEFQEWAKTKLSLVGEGASSGFLDELKKRIDYLGSLQRSDLFSDVVFQSTVSYIKKILEDITHKIELFELNKSAHENLKEVVQIFKSTMQHCIQFIFYISNGKQDIPIDCTITNLCNPPSINPLKKIMESSTGKYLGALLKTTHFSLLYYDRYENNQRQIENALSLDQSLKKKDLANMRRYLCDVPHIIIDNDMDLNYLQSSFFNNAELPKDYIKFLNLLQYIALFTLIFDRLITLANTGGDIIVYGLLNDKVLTFTNRFLELTEEVRGTVESIYQQANGHYRKLAREQKSSKWMSNFHTFEGLYKLVVKDCSACKIVLNKITSQALNTNLKSLAERFQDELADLYSLTNEIREHSLEAVGKAKRKNLNISNTYKVIENNSQSSLPLSSILPRELSTIEGIATQGHLTTPLVEKKDIRESTSPILYISDQLTFVRCEVSGDGQCGYTAFGITRKDAYDLIKSRLNEVRVLLLPVVKEEVLSEKFINYLKEKGIANAALLAEYNKYKAAAEQGGNMNINIIDNLYQKIDLTAIQGYIDYDINDMKVYAGWSHPCVLQTLAYLREIKLYIWRVERNELIPHRTDEYDYSVYEPPKYTQSTHLLFTGGNHFDRLEPHNNLVNEMNRKQNNFQMINSGNGNQANLSPQQKQVTDSPSEIQSHNKPGSVASQLLTNAPNQKDLIRHTTLSGKVNRIPLDETIMKYKISNNTKILCLQEAWDNFVIYSNENGDIGIFNIIAGEINIIQREARSEIVLFIPKQTTIIFLTKLGNIYTVHLRQENYSINNVYSAKENYIVYDAIALPDNKLICCTSTNKLILFDLNTFCIIAEEKVDHTYYKLYMFDSSKFVAGRRGSIDIWNISGIKLNLLNGINMPWSTACIPGPFVRKSENELIIAESDVKNSSLINTLFSPIGAVSFTLYQVNVSTNKKESYGFFEGYAKPITHLFQSSNKYLISCSEGCNIKIHNLETKLLEHKITCENDIYSLTQLKDGRLVYGCDNGILYIQKLPILQIEELNRCNNRPSN